MVNYMGGSLLQPLTPAPSQGLAGRLVGVASPPHTALVGVADAHGLRRLQATPCEAFSIRCGSSFEGLGVTVSP